MHGLEEFGVENFVEEALSDYETMKSLQFETFL
jgi:hypothetical protein